MVAQNSARFLVRLMARRRRTFLIIIPVNILIVWVLYNGWAVGDRSIIRWSFLMDRTFFRNSIPGFVTSRKHDKPTGTVLAILPSVNAEIPFNAEYILHDVLGHTIHQCTHSLTLPPKDCQMATGKCWDHLLLWPGDFNLANSIPNWGLHKCPNASVSSFPELKETLLSRPILKQLRQANGVLKSFHFPNETEEAEFHFAGKFLTIFKSTGQSKERPKLMERVVNGKPWRDTWQTASGNSTGVVQEFLQNPLLFHGRLFQIGVFVAVISIEPLRVYVYEDDASVSVCSEFYEPFDPKHGHRYIITEENSWRLSEVPEIKAKLKNRRGSVSASDKQILAEFFADQTNLSFVKIWTRFGDVLRGVFSLSQMEFIRRIETAWNIRVTDSRVSQLMQANFLVDILGDVHLMDVRAAEPFAKNEKLATLHEFYQLIGMDKDSCPSDFRDQLEAFCPPECRQNFEWCSRVKCKSTCYQCLSPTQKLHASRFHCEFTVTNHYKRILPSSEVMLSPTLNNDAVTQSSHVQDSNEWMTAWFLAHYDKKNNQTFV